MKSRRSRNPWAFRLAAVVIAVLPFLLLELTLRTFGSPDDQESLNRGIKATVPLFTFDETSQTYTTSLPYQQFFAEVSFRPKATPGGEQVHGTEKLIFVLGGSTVQGRPFAPATAFPAWTECLLNESGGSSPVRVVNCGGVSFASDRLRQIVPELLTYDPDLIVIATGHNEFLEDHTYFHSKAGTSGLGRLADSFGRLKTVSLLRKAVAARAVPQRSDEVPAVNHEVKARLDNEAGYDTYHYDSDWHQAVLKQFGQSIENMIGQCNAAKVPVVVVDLASNSRDCAPFKSEHAPTVSEQRRVAWAESMQQAEAAIELMHWDHAIPLLRDCLQNSPEHALTHFRLARCFRATNDTEQAARHFQRAIDDDICPLRMKSEFHQTLKDICQQHAIPRLDCKNILGPLSTEASMSLGAGSGAEPGLCFGFELFLDHVHPTVRAHQVIGAELAKLIQQTGIVSAGKQPQSDPADPAGFQDSVRLGKRIQALPTTYFANGRRRIGWLEKWARTQKTAREVTPMTYSDVIQRIRRRLELRDVECAAELWSVVLDAPESTSLLRHVRDEFLQSGESQPVTSLNALLMNAAEFIDDEFIAADSGRSSRQSNTANLLLTDVQVAQIREILNRSLAE